MTITTSIINLKTSFNEEGLLEVLSFSVLASADTGESSDFPVLKIAQFPPPTIGKVTKEISPATDDAPAITIQVWGEYTQQELSDFVETAATEVEAYAYAESQLKVKMFKPIPVPVPPAPPTDAERKQMLAEQVDARVKFIYNKFMGCRMEYEMREAQAHEFKNGGYVGEPGKLVKGFAIKSGLNYTAATDLTLAQANGLRSAIPMLGDLRMDKYTIAGATSLQEAYEFFNTTMAAIDVIERSL